MAAQARRRKGRNNARNSLRRTRRYRKWDTWKYRNDVQKRKRRPEQAALQLPHPDKKPKLKTKKPQRAKQHEETHEEGKTDEKRTIKAQDKKRQHPTKMAIPRITISKTGQYGLTKNRNSNEKQGASQRKSEPRHTDSDDEEELPRPKKFKLQQPNDAEEEKPAQETQTTPSERRSWGNSERRPRAKKLRPIHADDANRKNRPGQSSAIL